MQFFEAVRTGVAARAGAGAGAEAGAEADVVGVESDSVMADASAR